MVKRSSRVVLLLASFLLAGCDLPIGSEKAIGLVLTLQVDSVISAGDTLPFTAHVRDSRDRPVAGVEVQFALGLEGNAYHSSEVSATTDRNGRAAATMSAPPAGHYVVTASSPRSEEIAPVTAKVRVRATARFSVDSLSLTGPSCTHTSILGYGGSGNRLETIVVQDTGVVHVMRGIPFTGGTMGYLGFSVWPRAAGTTRIIGTYQDGVDTVVVRVSAPASGVSLPLSRSRPGDYPGTLVPESVTLAAGDTVTVGVTTGSCEPRAMPVGYAIRYQSSDSTVVRVESVEFGTFDTRTYQGSFANARLRAVGKGTARITATAPFSPTATYTVTVQ